MHGYLPWLVGAAIVWGFIGAILRSIARGTERERGRRAYLAGEKLNARWSRSKREGWSEAWGSSLESRIAKAAQILESMNER